jgi:hypothetical protein
MTTIYQYFTDKLGAAPADDTLRQLPINSNTSGHPSGSADVRCWQILFSNSGSGCQALQRSSLPGPLFSPR